MNLKQLCLGGYLIASLIATPFIIKWEGQENHAYKDIVGVVTICSGETRGVKIGDYKTDDECEAMTQEAVLEFAEYVDDVVTVDVSPKTHAAITSFTYNVGKSALKGSTLLRKLNRGDYVGACNEMLRWNRAGGRVVQGLVNRRKAENALCLDGIE